MSKAEGLSGIFNIGRLIRRRASQRGPGGGARSLHTENLARIGFVDRVAGQRLPHLTRLFVQYSIDPIATFKQNPDLRPTELRMPMDEQIFYILSHQRIIRALNNVVEAEMRQDMKMDTNGRVNTILSYLHSNPSTKMPWESELWSGLQESAVLQMAQRTSGMRPSVNVRNLINIGFLSRVAAKSVYQRVTERFVHFIIDPADSLWNNPYQHPFRIKLSADEVRTYVKIHKLIIDLLKPVIIDFEAGATSSLSTDARVAMLHGIIKQI
jgi:hypothetical protein